ncbi:MAG: heparinase II/III family protein [Candidatus Celaenobacter antarcticus]|nr:heparinase II/III family protein [Candidatus Celaenobacter antarcticus]
MKSCKIFFIIILLMLLSSFLYAEGSWHPGKTYWPRTLIDSSQAAIDYVRTRVTVEPYLSIYNTIKIKSDVDYAACTTELQKAVVARCAAFRFFIDEVTEYGDKAVDYLLVMQRESYSNVEEQYKNILWDSEMLSLACIAYDFLKGNDYSFDGVEDAVRAKIQDIAGEMYYDLVSSPEWSGLHLLWFVGFGEQINYGVKFASALGMCAIVLNTETPIDTDKQPETWINYTMQKTDLQFSNWLVNEQGMWAEGPHYLTFTASSFIPFALSHNNFVNGESEDYGGEILPPLTQNDNFRELLYWGIKIRQPNGARPNFDDSFLNPYFFNGMLAPIYNDDVLEWDYVHSAEPDFVGATSQNIDVEMICTDYQTVFPGTTPPDFPPTQIMPDAGQAVFRSDWGEDAVYMCAIAENGQAREGGRTHEHPDNGSFIIYALGELLAMDSGYISWEKRDSVRYAKNHSMVLVDGEGPPAATLTTAGGTDATIGINYDTNGLDCAQISTNYQDTDFFRIFTFINDSYFTITDMIGSSSTHDYSFLLHGNGGGSTGNGFSLDTNGSTYSVNDVDLNFFINSAHPINLDNYDDYHDDGTYDVLATHTVTRAQINAQFGLITSFLIPTLATTKDIVYTPINTDSTCGGSLEMGSEKIIHMGNGSNSLQTVDFFGTSLEYDALVLHVAQNGDIPRNIQLTSGQTFNYGSTPLIYSDVDNMIALNIGAASADGYVEEACTIEFFTGNEPTSVEGGTLLGFFQGVSTISFNSSSNFTIDVIWSLDYAVNPDPSPHPYNLSIYPNPFSQSSEISFDLTVPQNVEIEVFNLRGQKIATLTDEDYGIGSHSVLWDGKNQSGKTVANGTYLYKIHFNKGDTILRKVNILK